MRFGATQLSKYREVLAKRQLPKVLRVFDHVALVNGAVRTKIAAWLTEHSSALQRSWIAAGIADPKSYGPAMCFDVLLHFVADTGQAVVLQQPSPSYSWWLNCPLPPAIGRVQCEGARLGLETYGSPIHWIEPAPREEVATEVRLLREDHNPFNKHNAHPDVEFVPYDLGEISFDHWKAQFTEAFSCIEDTIPELYRLMLPFLDSLVPMGYTPEKQLSSSYKETPGILYLSYTETVLKQAEALVHEIHHTIFNAIDAVTPLLENTLEEKYISGYRPDPRHIRGCLLGLHAFTAVEQFYWTYLQSHQGQEDMESLLATIHNQNQQTLETVTVHGQCTKHGQAFLADIKDLHAENKNAYMKLPEATRHRAEEQQRLHGEGVKQEIDKMK